MLVSCGFNMDISCGLEKIVLDFVIVGPRRKHVWHSISPNNVSALLAVPPIPTTWEEAGGQQTGKIVANKYTSNSVKRCLPSKFHQLTKSKALQVQLLAASCSHSVVLLYFPRAGGACTRVLQFHVGLKRATNPCHLPTLLPLTTLGQSCHSWAVNITIINRHLYGEPHFAPVQMWAVRNGIIPAQKMGQSPQRFSNDSVQMPHVVVPPQNFINFRL